MPKHNIYPHPNPDGTDADRRVEVGWQRDCAVQIGVARLVSGHPKIDVVYPGSPTTLGAPTTFSTITTSGTALFPGEPTWESQHVELDRDQINRLIRTLREARDAAFGRDE